MSSLPIKFSFSDVCLKFTFCKFDLDCVPKPIKFGVRPFSALPEGKNQCQQSKEKADPKLYVQESALRQQKASPMSVSQ
ncbi:MAG: hypothetical protein A3J30_00495 [Candidatus Wildermuthbacteria bacterium RIFCSPLOWO2_02_FULL_47_9c]|uniref:Uncharacterized protein n=1 Tax=Candidatus Wildermuthbacteria bacterium RIFCSPLOWO2_02_FULL_47_9c TaxID=1802466 RepID=A0A1G2RVK5_9BACT|nr:MAG: hypothetical protein A2109_01075 [Candidatus Wildermuthbacteria bacterium GWA1_49_26]OHA66202.1 MAG: hypothetical protein A2674_01960 [Candidatus Wildermuthbacteria bacterium RIFCSPHIGHO2_01_FULL_50_47]OHA69801.1 MAG: hypothetical protein A3D63_00980 [Candidatus Wildermuthbacteria bacterium RIFCSPHIGHO2_02_FULL_49_17]OHA71668.1 MAG: hypothetical protein A3E08_01585 [Candidatus Wildermuthbacteria bacterium RIFCSPHIGHO2_12_FULL_49_13]OHA74288.1 MAG: hypothetical protein A3B28_02435 [Candi